MRTCIRGDICPHNVRTMFAQHLPRETYILREMLCGHCADIERTYISRDICPHYNLLGFHLSLFMTIISQGSQMSTCVTCVGFRLRMLNTSLCDDIPFPTFVTCAVPELVPPLDADVSL